MLFNSIEFLIFFPIVTLLFYLMPQKWRWLLLLAASCFFYMWFIPKYIFILLITILIDYSAGILIEKWKDDIPKKKACLVVSIVSTCMVLFIFKYLNFCSANLVALAQHLGWSHPQKILNIALPIGLSFHTFQSLSYVIEVCRGNQKAERHFGYYALYVMFYPQLVTGPIERPQNLLRQLHEHKELNYDNIANGLRLILFGLFLKMVVADNLAVYVDKIYENPFDYSSGDILLGMLFYSFQIYGDFFGYSTIALGCALAMGYSLMDNFKTPYLSGSVQEFWRRWHISLSTWFRDYLYIPLGGNRVAVPRWALNTLIVFTVCGIWHGANWTFMIWGFAYGVLLILERGLRNIHLFDRIEGKAGRLVINTLNVAKTFVIVTLLWSVFRATSFGNLHDLFTALFHNGAVANQLHVAPVAWISLILFVFLDILIRDSRFDVWCGRQKPLVRWCVYAFLIFAVIALSSVEQIPFIYFQF
ncbi:MAG: MBOAT family protein [Bacteroidales bacterium]|nr:MBOAT family protein [Bacteroidales bacterium]